jgi:hypothetical protein
LAGVSPGLADAIKARGCTPPVVQSVRLSDGAVDEQSDRDNQLGLVMVPWKDFQDVLANSIPPQQIHCRHRLQSFEPVEVRSPPLFPFLSSFFVFIDFPFFRSPFSKSVSSLSTHIRYFSRQFSSRAWYIAFRMLHSTIK